MKDKIGWDLGI